MTRRSDLLCDIPLTIAPGTNHAAITPIVIAVVDSLTKSGTRTDFGQGFLGDEKIDDQIDLHH